MCDGLRKIKWPSISLNLSIRIKTEKMTGSGHLPLVATSTKYSTLELVKHDAGTAASEGDRAIFASDSGRHLDAPQVREEEL